MFASARGAAFARLKGLEPGVELVKGFAAPNRLGAAAEDVAGFGAPN